MLYLLVANTVQIVLRNKPWLEESAEEEKEEDPLKRKYRENLETWMANEKPYLNPEFRPDYAHPNCLIRSLGNYLAVLALDPECAADWENLSVRVARLMEKIDFEHFSGAGTVPLLYGSSLLKKRV